MPSLLVLYSVATHILPMREVLPRHQRRRLNAQANEDANQTEATVATEKRWSLEEIDAVARHIAVGMIDGKHWSAIFTLRTGRVRLISVRRSREREVKHYESQ